MDLRATVSVKGAIFEGKAPAIVRSERDAMLDEIVMLLEREVKKRTPVGVFGAQGGLLAGIHGQVIGKGQPVAHGLVSPHSPHGDVAELGRRPGGKFPPEGTLLRWLEVKLGLSESDAKRVEFLVRRKIGRKGFKGAHMFENALKDNLSRMDAIAQVRGFKIAARLNNE